MFININEGTEVGACWVNVAYIETFEPRTDRDVGWVAARVRLQSGAVLVAALSPDQLVDMWRQTF